MRTPVRRGHGALVTTLLVAAALVAACAEAAPSPSPTVAPTPTATPNPHLADPATADEVFLALGAGGLRLTANNAAPGAADGPLVKRINATYLGWPLSLSEYRSTDALAEATAWEADVAPGAGDPPVAIAGLNILVEWGPAGDGQPKEPVGAQVTGLRDLAARLDLLLSPLRARSVVDVPGLTASATTAASASPEPTPKP